MFKIICILSLAVSAYAGYISQLDRALQLLQPDLVITTTRISYVPSSKSEHKFIHTVANDFKDTLVSVVVKDTMNHELKVSSMPSRNSTVIQFTVDIKDLITDRLKEINLEITEMHKNRRTPNPEEAKITEL